MPAGERPTIKSPADCVAVYELLEQVCLRPSMWVRRGSLEHLSTFITGYSTALLVHGLDEPFDLAPGGPFAERLRQQYGWSMSCGWATAIEDNAPDSVPLEAFVWSARSASSGGHPAVRVLDALQS